MPFWRRSAAGVDDAATTAPPAPPPAPPPDPASAQRVFVRAAATPSTSGPVACTKEARPAAVGYDGRTDGGGAGGCPVVPGAARSGGCPVVPGGAGPGVDPRNLMPADLSSPPSSPPPPGLSSDRVRSSIPVAPGADLPQHQGDGASPSSSAAAPQTWTYPSEAQFYEAMRRKGWNPDASDMPAVVAIHNAVNERAWAEVVAWERRAGAAAACGGPRLVKFAGRPGDLSPKARLLNLLGYARPFDRHDWVVDRCGARVRYVIDFYNGAAPGAPVAVHLDVRPALDSPGALLERLGRQWEWVASGRWRSV